MDKAAWAKGAARAAIGGALALATLIAPFAAQAAELTRRGALGVALAPAEGGALVQRVEPGLTAARLGLREGDVIVGMNGAPTPNPAALVQAVRAIRAGDRVALRYKREGRDAEARGLAEARPKETYVGATAKYGAVAFNGGLLRDIMVAPANARPDAPVVYLIQGYYCGSMEAAGPTDPYRELAQALADRGVATYRVEKPGMGDSLGGRHCLETDFATELAAFKAGFAALTRDHGVDPGRVVLLGHSMGGVQAPLLAADGPQVRGVAVFGTVLRSWHDYMIDLMRLQSHFREGTDPAQGEALAEAMRGLLDTVFRTDLTLAAIAARGEQEATLLREVLDWDGKDLILGRTAAYWRGVAAQRMTAAWRDAKAPALAMYGEADFAAIDERDHVLIAEIVNHYRPGTGRHVIMARTGHGMELEGARAEVRARTKAGTQPPRSPFNPEVAKVLGDWILSLPAPAGRVTPG
jgi:pimeloyl-ACP methyl ester carboxylesterase